MKISSKKELLHIIETTRHVSMVFPDDSFAVAFSKEDEQDISYNSKIYYSFLRSLAKKFSSLKYKSELSIEDIEKEVLTCFEEIKKKYRIEVRPKENDYFKGFELRYWFNAKKDEKTMDMKKNE